MSYSCDKARGNALSFLLVIECKADQLELREATGILGNLHANASVYEPS